ncbi:uncharacterized protein LOC110177126 [Drosophila serrata]|uniref:uncharacterized protein LOC110177126 n=1 Tax=Drosophila serrata TaxID=7274 RepID=UPI000A1D0AF1|nr:uncharacterized protein LOC110177126 [Drosophila serrata]
MSCHPLNLGKIAQSSAKIYICPMPSTIRCFYHSTSTTATQVKVAPKGTVKASEKPRKVIGVKKTMVNQMQGMVHSPDAPKEQPYKIYGKTRMFSSTSSLQSQSGSSISRRWMSSGLKKKKQQQQWDEDSKPEAISRSSRTNLSATQRRYNQSMCFGRGLATQAAREISRSIQEELMVVDAETRDMINCNPGRQEKRDQGQGTFDPMQGWNHPRPYKPITGVSEILPEVLDARQNRPRRRQLVVDHANHAANVAARSRESLAKTQRPQHLNPKAKIGQLSSMYSFNVQERVSDPRPTPSCFLPQSVDEKDSDDSLMDVSIARGMRTDFTKGRGISKTEETEEEPNSLYEQPLAEREFLKRAFLGGTGGSRHASQSRMDELHYESSAGVGSNEALMSASRQVINQKFAGFQQLTGTQRWRAPHLVASVNPTPQLTSRAVGEARGSVLKQGKRRFAVRSSAERVPTPNFYGGFGEVDKSTPKETEDRNRVDDCDESTGESWNRQQEQEGPKDVKSSEAIRQSRVMASGPPRHRSMYEMSTQDKEFEGQQLEMKMRNRNASVVGRMTTTKGEKRDLRLTKKQDYEPENDIKMPLVYEKQSAVQRLSPTIPAQHGTRAHNSY